MNWPKRFLTPPLIVIASLLMWLEESLWKFLKWLTAWLAIFPLIRQVEKRLVQLSPVPTLIIFLLPMISLFPLKLMALYWVSHGYWLASLGLIAFAKILGTAIVARMYVVCQPQLMTIGWFRRLHDGLIAIRDRLNRALRALPIYHAARAFLDSVKASARRFLATLRVRRGLWARWRAIRRLNRQKSRT